ncbi:YbhB/YbcL family Raf kinase inhibitor-like protein [Arthrobacter sp. W4I7]|uniref:YbhB/YbcL family Raf kinase inhibitor-like protein n=1 Tax=Arthrobacter sp. W4I7 TaxID=3042296 RepID=UPI00277D9AF9|nr:YbhB/YbcL family Raf kinase inhibitor-like protein [Arthrobacter sp. W4I7]MDQ0691324.1 Raf kinase inhibitor-like YbhB/YbcL family protein [Arthrobacter sp. W4I7]
MNPHVANLSITSPDIEPEGRIGEHLTALGGDTPPQLFVTGLPDGTQELAIICHDPDAPLPNGFTHWLIYGIQPSQDPSGMVVDASSGRQGQNGSGGTGYLGPVPPVGHGLHHYYFWVYALKESVKGEPSREDFLNDYADGIIEQNRLVGTYSR